MKRNVLTVVDHSNQPQQREDWLMKPVIEAFDAAEAWEESLPRLQR